MAGLFVESKKGKIANFPRYYRQALEKLASLHEEVVNQRRDFLHKQANVLVEHYDDIIYYNIR